MTTVTETIPTFSNIPSTSDPTNFDSEADNFLGTQLPAFVTSANTWAGQVNTVAGEVNTNATTATTKASEASASALAAAASAASADTYADNAAATAAFKGSWGSLSGALNIPASVEYNGSIYVLLSNLADVTTKVPGVASEWSLLTGITRETRTSNTVLGSADDSKFIDVTSGTFSQTFVAVATLGAGWMITYRNSGTGIVTLDPNSSETIEGSTTLALYPGETAMIFCNGSALFAVISSRNAGDHHVVVHTGNGHGSTNTKIRRFTTAMTNTGTAITYADSATAGASFTVNHAGLYEVHYSEVVAGSASLGISVNSAELTTDVQSILIATRRAIAIAAAGQTAAVTRTLRLAAGDIVRPHSNGASTDTSDKVFFSIRKLGN